MPRASKDASLGTLLRFITKLQENRTDFPHLDTAIAKLLNLVALIQEAAAQQAAHIAGKQEASRRQDEHLSAALRLLTVMRVSLKEHYGIRSEKLAEFGIQPFRGRSRKVKPVTENPEIQAAEPQGAPSAEPPGSEQ
jgi:hypothetical protein